MRQTRANPQKRKPEHSLAKPKKQIKSSNQELPCSQEKSKSEIISDPSSQKSSNQESSSSQEKSISIGNSDQSSQNKEPKQQKLVPIVQIVNDNFNYEPKNQNPYKHLIQMAATPYDFNLETSQWISPQIIRYRPLNASRYVFVGDNQTQSQGKIYLQKSEKMKQKLNIIRQKIGETRFHPVYYFRGPSGIGKSYGLIQWVLENRKRDNEMRILHIILDDDYIKSPSFFFANDFIYCFYNDLNNEDFPNPPSCNYIKYDRNMKKGEKWFTFLSNQEISISSSLKMIYHQYLEKKGIAFILIWDQDNIFHKNEKSPFLKSIRDNEKYNFKLISASNTNEGFADLDKNNKVIEENVGFSRKESQEYLDNTLEKMYGKELKMEDKLFEELYQITNGNGYYLSQFVYNEKVANNYQEKFNRFTDDMKRKLETQMEKFFEEKLNKSRDWEKEFPKLLVHLDCDKSFDKEFQKMADRNFTYFEDSKLKSVNPFAKEIFVNFYQEKIKEWKHHTF